MFLVTYHSFHTLGMKRNGTKTNYTKYDRYLVSFAIWIYTGLYLIKKKPQVKLFMFYNAHTINLTFVGRI